MEINGRSRFFQTLCAGAAATAAAAAPLPWPALRTPTYRVGGVGPWRLAQEAADDGIASVRGFFTPQLPHPKSCWVLRRYGQVWMSVAPFEMETAVHHVAALTGDVMLMGLGMGVVAYNAALKPDVRSVRVIERDHDVIDLFHYATDGMPDWRAPLTKITITEADALAWRGTDVDCLYADIWQGFGDETLRPTLVMKANVEARRTSWWGQELEFLRFMCAVYADLHVDDLASAHWDAFGAAHGLALIERENVGFIRLVRRALSILISEPPVVTRGGDARHAAPVASRGNGR